MSVCECGGICPTCRGKGPVPGDLVRWHETDGWHFGHVADLLLGGFVRVGRGDSFRKVRADRLHPWPPDGVR